MGRNRTSNSNTLLEKSQISSNRGTKRQLNSSSLNNNITTSPNQNSYLPILPKYEAAAALFGVMAPRDGSYPPTSLPSTTGLHPFYLPPSLHLGAGGHPINQYSMSASIGQILEQLHSQNQSLAKVLPQNDIKTEVKQEVEESKKDTEEDVDENR